jgi:NADPH-dependent curcumin reductase CurA
MTAYTGLFNIGQPKAGETLVVAAALAPSAKWLGKSARSRAAESSASPAGSRSATSSKEELGFDDCLDERQPGPAGIRSQHAPRILTSSRLVSTRHALAA